MAGGICRLPGGGWGGAGLVPARSVPGPGAGRAGPAVVTGFSAVSGSRQRRRPPWGSVTRTGRTIIPRTYVSRVVAGAVISAALAAGSLSLTATAAGSCTTAGCITGVPPAAVPSSIVTGYRQAKDDPQPGVAALYAGGGGGHLCGTPTTPDCPLS